VAAVSIAVSGTASVHRPAERGTVRLAARFEGQSRQGVVSSTAELMVELQAAAKRFVTAGAATWWGADTVFASSFKRYIKNSDVTQTVQYAAAGITVKFGDFAALAGWVSEVSAKPGVTVSGIDWTITDVVRTEVQKQVRIEAVRRAQEKAAAYASALGAAAPPVLVAIYEEGLRPDVAGGGAMLAAGGVRALRAASASGESFEFKPGDIEVSASITADFLVDL
jgi:uncharacterized protein